MRGSYKTGYNILESSLGSPYSGKLPVTDEALSLTGAVRFLGTRNQDTQCHLLTLSSHPIP